MYRILVCDDEKDIVSALRICLKSEGYEVDSATNGKEAVQKCRNGKYDLLLLDIMMPVMDGIAAMASIREFSNIPILLLTAKGEDADIIHGLNVGADDYVTKPFYPAELMARVRSQLRRYLQLGGGGEERSASVYTVDGIVLDVESGEVTRDGEPVVLTRKEFGILRLLMSRPGQIFTPTKIYQEVWGEDPYGVDNIVAVHIRHLRGKIEYNPAEPRYLKVVWGKGYKIEKRGT